MERTIYWNGYTIHHNDCTCDECEQDRLALEADELGIRVEQLKKQKQENNRNMATATKMTREQMIEKLDTLKVGVRIQRQGKTYTVMSVNHCGGKLSRRDISILEDGKRDSYEIPGKYLAAGTMIEMCDREYHSLYAQKSHMNFEIID